MHEMCSRLSESSRAELLNLWEEYEARHTNEARFVKAVETMEGYIQYTLADIATWDQGDYDICIYHREELFDFDPDMKECMNAVYKEEMRKIFAAKMEGRVDPAKLARYHQETQV